MSVFYVNVITSERYQSIVNDVLFTYNVYSLYNKFEYYLNDLLC